MYFLRLGKWFCIVFLIGFPLLPTRTIVNANRKKSLAAIRGEGWGYLVISPSVQ